MRKGYLLGWMLLASSVCMGAGLPQENQFTFPITDVRLIPDRSSMQKVWIFVIC